MMTKGQKALLIDITLCGGCRDCMAACMDAHGFEDDPFEVEKLSATAYTVLTESQDGEWYARKMCRHCVEPSCASVCPVGALEKTDLGPVVYDASKCLGCRYCIQACPQDVPRYEWDRAVPAVAKCDMCYERIRDGGIPACAEACLNGATMFGDREEILAEARQRVSEDPDLYHPHICGEDELGGSCVIILSPVPLTDLGIADGFPTRPLPELTAEALARVPGIVVMGGALMFAISWITRRRSEVARAETEQVVELQRVGSGDAEEREDVR
jgi:formate dehydrogenase iron-sulfur subunit